MVGGQRVFIHLEGCSVPRSDPAIITMSPKQEESSVLQYDRYSLSKETIHMGYSASRSGVGAIIGGTMGLFTHLLFPMC